MTKQQRLNRLYSKERAKVRQRIRKAEKEGFSGISLPNKPKRITEASIRKMQSYTSKYINERMTKTVDGQEITRKQAIVRSRWNRPKKQKIEISLPQTETTPVNIPTLDIFETQTETETETFNEIDFLIDHLLRLCENILDYPIEKYATACHSILTDAIESKRSDLLAGASEEEIEAFRSIASAEIFVRTFYESDQVKEAVNWAQSLYELADYFKNQALKDVADEMVSADEEWQEITDVEDIWDF